MNTPKNAMIGDCIFIFVVVWGVISIHIAALATFMLPSIEEYFFLQSFFKKNIYVAFAALPVYLCIILPLFGCTFNNTHTYTYNSMFSDED